jgi:hypothetical protein
VQEELSAASVAGCILAFVGTGIVIGVHFGAARHFRIPVAFGFIAFGFTFTLGCTAVACLACHAVIIRLAGRVRWKGRRYRLTKTSPGRT